MNLDSSLAWLCLQTSNGQTNRLNSGRKRRSHNELDISVYVVNIMLVEVERTATTASSQVLASSTMKRLLPTILRTGKITRSRPADNLPKNGDEIFVVYFRWIVGLRARHHGCVSKQPAQMRLESFRQSSLPSLVPLAPDLHSPRALDSASLYSQPERLEDRSYFTFASLELSIDDIGAPRTYFLHTH